MSTVAFIDVFSDLDRMDGEAWLTHLAPDVVMRFANEPAVYGHAGCRAGVESLIRSVTSISHEIIERWEHGNATIVECAVAFGLPDRESVTLPMVTVYRTNATGLIVDYRVYVDPRPLWG